MRKLQRGVALLTVMVVLVLCVLAVAANTRSGLLHEMLVGHQSDQLRAQAAAEALVRDAEIDILGVLPDGSPCQPLAPGAIGCRMRGGEALPGAPYFPSSIDEFEEARALVQVGAAIPCRDGICFPASLQALEHIEDALDTMQAVGAHYGQFTRSGLAASAVTGNPLLAPTPARAWYWIEAFLYDIGPDSLKARGHLQPDPVRPFVYRITAVALGLKPGTRAVVKSVFVPYPSEQMQ
ncbi:pilus assembly protein [Pseudorhodoferax sp. Leaf267]|uniref:pilus assembly protein n=1 Tax=Pseudorhodoferax sp. Leaf267 TaxID=1736316 RepID=UPI00138F9029|nr:hypothetical protein [Pseudorhodoferax sp. Leaf267]